RARTRARWCCEMRCPYTPGLVSPVRPSISLTFPVCSGYDESSLEQTTRARTCDSSQVPNADCGPYSWPRVRSAVPFDRRFAVSGLVRARAWREVLDQRQHPEEQDDPDHHEQGEG